MNTNSATKNQGQTTLAAPLLEALGRSATPGLEAVSLPPECYVSQEFYNFEQQAIFGQEWFAVGRVNDIPRKGDYFTVTVADESLVVVRGDDQINILSNVCQHRGSLLVEGSGNCGRSLLCPYHHWSYDVSGALVGAPFMKETPAFDRRSIRLPSLPVKLWNGFIFTTLNPLRDDTPLPDRDNFSKFCQNYDLESLVGPAAELITVDWNWKIMMENAGECYHCTALHGELHDTAPTRNTMASPLRYEDNAFATQVRNTGIDTDFNPDRMIKFPALSRLTVDERSTSTWVSLPPNLFISLQHDNSHYFLLLPRGPEKTDMLVGYLYPQSTYDLPDFAQRFEEVSQAISAIMAQDTLINTRVQAGMRSRFAQQGRFSWLEESVHLFDRWLAERYLEFHGRSCPNRQGK